VLTIYLICADQALVEVCRGVLDHLGLQRGDLRVSANGIVPEETDICIWDTESMPKVPAAMFAADHSTKLVIVRKALLPSVRDRLPPEGKFLFLHSPVSKLTLRVFLESAIARLESARSGRNGIGTSGQRDVIFQKLLETNWKLQEYDTERTCFLTRAVHDIRAPLMAIQGYCGLLLAGQFGATNDDQVQILERMQRSLERLGRLAEAMMELGMGGKAATKLKLENSCVESCVNQAVHEIRPIAQQKQIDVALELTPPIAPLFFDSSQMEQVLVNLLDNSCKFTQRRGSIKIRGYSVYPDSDTTETSFGGYRLDIDDTGPGIAKDRIEHVFDEYTSYGGPTDRSGSGLGLAICKLIVSAHNGRIWATSERSGTTVSLVLPYPRTQVEHKSNLQVMTAAV
jgi:signal transduction histidine kinase